MNLQQQIEALLPNERIHQLPDDVGSLHETENDKSFNEALSLCKQSLPKIIELIEKDTRERIRKSIDIKTYYNDDGVKSICYDELINLINKE